MGGISIWQLLIIAVIILLLFGSKKLRGLGGDLGAALRGFKKEMHDDKDSSKTQNQANKESVEHKADADFSSSTDDSKRTEQPTSSTDKRD